jgi:GT2 family glycosyltransferase
VSRAAIQKVGIFEENFFAYYEESDYCVRVKRAGLRVVLDTELEIFHRGSISVHQVKGMQEYLMMRNRLIFVRRNGSGAQYFSALLYALLLYGPKRTMRALIKGRVWLGGILARAWIAGVTNQPISDATFNRMRKTK